MQAENLQSFPTNFRTKHPQLFSDTSWVDLDDLKEWLRRREDLNQLLYPTISEACVIQSQMIYAADFSQYLGMSLQLLFTHDRRLAWMPISAMLRLIPPSLSIFISPDLPRRHPASVSIHTMNIRPQTTQARVLKSTISVPQVSLPLVLVWISSTALYPTQVWTGNRRWPHF